MAWTTPKTWAVGDPATAADLNTYVRDNTNYLYGLKNYAARAYLANAYNMPYGVDGTVIPVDTVDYDPSGMFTLGAGAKITVPVAGLYLFEGKWATGGMTSGSRGFVSFTGSSGAMNRHGFGDKSGLAAGYFSFEGAAMVNCAAGSTMQLSAYQSAANPSLAVLTGLNVTWFSATLIR